MSEPTISQTIFENYLRQRVSLEQAADALTALIRDHKAAGAALDDLALRKPDGLPLAEADLTRADSLFAEMHRRATAD